MDYIPRKRRIIPRLFVVDAWVLIIATLVSVAIQTATPIFVGALGISMLNLGLAAAVSPDNCDSRIMRWFFETGVEPYDD